MNNLSEKTDSANIQYLKKHLRCIEDFPKQGINFRDVTTLFKDANGNNKSIVINLINVVAGEKYKLAISWLMKGSTIRAMNRLPIHMAVGVFQNQNLLSLTSSATPNEQPYTLQTFTAPQSGTITISIICQNDAPNDPMTFGYHMALVP